MVYRFLFLCLVVVASVFAVPVEQERFKCLSTNRFAPLTQFSLQTLPGYGEQFAPYLIGRGVSDEMSMELFFQEDLFHIAQALSILFEQDTTAVLYDFLGEYVSLIEGYDTQIDHVGRELFGPISFYLPLLEKIAPEMGLKKVRHLVFPSTQVVKVLQEHDPSVRGVTIGRVYFQSEDTGRVKCIELFQAAPQDGRFPQHINATRERLALLTASKGSSAVIPIDHISIEFSTIEEIEDIHTRIHQRASDTLLPYQKEVSHNLGDGSTQTKAVIRDSTEAPFNKIVEFVHYSQIN